MTENTDQDKAWAASLGYDEVQILEAGKRIGVQWTPWMGDWFTSWSPRNGNTHAEGYWAHWVELALLILQDPMTEHVRPELRALMAEQKRRDYYDDADVKLAPSQLRARLQGETP